MPFQRNQERFAVYIFGIVFVVTILVIAITLPEPTIFQYTVFRIILALAVAGVAAFIPGFIQVEISSQVRAGGAMAVFIIVYFFSPAQMVVKPPKKSSFVGVQAIKQERHLDLSGWKFVELKDRDEPISKGVFDDYYTLVKVRDDAGEFIGHHGTTGLKIDFLSDTHPIKITQAPDEDLKGLRSLKKYDVYLDISQESIDSEFTLHLKATYWNAFNANWAATPIMFPTNKLEFSIKFSSPIQDYSLSAFRRASGAVKKPFKKEFSNLSEDKTFLKWIINSPKLNYIYQVDWN